VYRFWHDLCQQHGQRVVVDVIAGTSAGGLNGAVLAAAIARGGRLPAALREA
jgi:predicted acylesterase/phospholipase RssA